LSTSGEHCANRLLYSQMRDFILSFWGLSDEFDYPTQTQRRENVQKLLLQAFNHNDKTFSFFIGGVNVCEHTVRELLCLQKSSQWDQVKFSLQHPEKYERQQLVKKSSKPTRVCAKTEHAKAFIKSIADLYGDDSIDLAQHATKGTKILPYHNVHDLFEMYEQHHKRIYQQYHTCSESTFNSAFKKLSEEGLVRLRGGKGSFETCATCNNIADAIKNSELRWTTEQLMMVLKLRKLHLDQQAAEREDSKTRRHEARTKIGNAGNLYLFYCLMFDLTCEKYFVFVFRS